MCQLFLPLFFFLNTYITSILPQFCKVCVGNKKYSSGTTNTTCKNEIKCTIRVEGHLIDLFLWFIFCNLVFLDFIIRIQWLFRCEVYYTYINKGLNSIRFFLQSALLLVHLRALFTKLLRKQNSLDRPMVRILL